MSFRPPRISYLVHEVLWDRRFADVFTQTEDGRLAIDYRRLHDTRPIQSASAYPSPKLYPGPFPATDC